MARYFKQSVLVTQGILGLGALNDPTYHASMVLERWYHPVAITADYVLTATAMPSGAAGQDVTTFAHQPDVARNVTAVASAAQTAHIIVYGTDIHGEAISEELTLNGTDTVTGDKAFETITKIHLNQRSGAANVTVGVGNKLGLSREPIGFLPEGLVDGTVESTLPVLNATNDTAVFNTALAATKDYVLKYWCSDSK